MHYTVEKLTHILNKPKYTSLCGNHLEKKKDSANFTSMKNQLKYNFLMKYFTYFKKTMETILQKLFMLCNISSLFLKRIAKKFYDQTVNNF